MKNTKKIILVIFLGLPALALFLGRFYYFNLEVPVSGTSAVFFTIDRPGIAAGLKHCRQFYPDHCDLGLTVINHRGQSVSESYGWHEALSSKQSFIYIGKLPPNLYVDGSAIISSNLSIILFSLVLIIYVLWLNLRRKVKSKDVCDKCGYLLTGNRSGKCPECGIDIHIKEKY